MRKCPLTPHPKSTGRKERNGESALKRLPPWRIAGLQKEHEILRLFMRFPLTFVQYASRKSTEKTRSGIDDDDTDGTKTQGHNSMKSRLPRTNPGSMRRGEKGASDDVVCVHFHTYFLCFWQVSTAESVVISWALGCTVSCKASQASKTRKTWVLPNNTHINEKSATRAARWCAC